MEGKLVAARVPIVLIHIETSPQVVEGLVCPVVYSKSWCFAWNETICSGFFRNFTGSDVIILAGEGNSFINEAGTSSTSGTNEGFEPEACF